MILYLHSTPIHITQPVFFSHRRTHMLIRYFQLSHSFSYIETGLRKKNKDQPNIIFYPLCPHLTHLIIRDHHIE